MLTGSSVRRMRQNLGMTQDSFADAIKVARSTVRRWEAKPEKVIPQKWETAIFKVSPKDPLQIIKDLAKPMIEEGESEETRSLSKLISLAQTKQREIAELERTILDMKIGVYRKKAELEERILPLIREAVSRQ